MAKKKGTLSPADIRASLTKKHEGLEHADSDLVAIPTGAVMLDAALGVGGWPQGRVIEVYGVESSGKSTLCLASMREAQRMGLFTLFLDYEQSFTEDYARLQGLEVDDANSFQYYQPETLEQGGDVIEAYVVASERPVFAVIDSVAAMLPKSFLEGDVIEERRLGEQARGLSQMFKRLLGRINRNNATCLFINHVQDKIGGFRPGKTTPGGRSLKFYASVRVELQPVESLRAKSASLATGKSEDVVVGSKIKATVVKNKVGIPKRVSTFYMRPPNGISEADTIFEMSVAKGLISRAGAYYTLSMEGVDPIRLLGRDAVLKHLNDDVDIRNLFRESLIASGMPVSPLAAHSESSMPDLPEGEAPSGGKSGQVSF